MGGGWPTLVIAAGHSEPLDELHNDMRWWFRTSNHDVKIVILAKFDDQQQYILLEKWEEESSHLQYKERLRGAELLPCCSRMTFSSR